MKKIVKNILYVIISCWQVIAALFMLHYAEQIDHKLYCLVMAYIFWVCGMRCRDLLDEHNTTYTVFCTRVCNKKV
jgi:hypothetical protein